jgi:hypothetical protein
VLSAHDLSPLTQYEGCSLWLYRRLVDLEILHVLGADFRLELSARARHIAAHTLRVEAQRDAVVRTLNALEIPHILLKGSALRLLGDRVPYADARLTTDVDILIPVDWVEGAWERLRNAGFEVATAEADKYEGHHHLAPLSNGLGVAVELHRSTSAAIAPRDAWRRMSTNSVDVTCKGGPTMVPSLTELLWHALTHAIALGPQGFRLRFFQDAALIIASGEILDWETLRGRLDSREVADPVLARGWLWAAAELAGRSAIPAWLSAGPSFDLRRALAWRAWVTSRFVSGEGTREDADNGESAVRSSRLLIEEGTRADLLELASSQQEFSTHLPRLETPETTS